MEDIKSYTAYAQMLLDKAIEQKLSKEPFEITDNVDDKIIIRDYYRVKNAEVRIKGGRVYCLLDESSDCDHVGFVLSNPQGDKAGKSSGLNFERQEGNITSCQARATASYRSRKNLVSRSQGCVRKNEQSYPKVLVFQDS